MTDFMTGAAQIFTLATLAYMLAGSVAGIVAAAIPGFTVTMAIVLTLPLTFTMEPLQGIAVMLSVYVGGYTGGLISAALLGIPGTPSSVATTFDAFPMARNGEPGRALSIGVWASFFGTVISTIVLIFAAPPLAPPAASGLELPELPKSKIRRAPGHGPHARLVRAFLHAPR